MRPLHRSGDQGEGGPNGLIFSIKRAVDGKGREAGISLMKNEKSTGPRTDLCGTPRRTGKNNFSDFEKPRKRAYQNRKIESNKQSKEGGQPK